jgi:predicted DCC family thiol-disulfide oxidoreductase YuxK
MTKHEALIIYDGDCIFCQNYARLVRLREQIGPIELLNARSDDSRVKRYWREGYDLNEGMLFILDGNVYFGAAAVSKLAQLSDPITAFSRFNKAIFYKRGVAAKVYPVLKFGRRSVLWLRGRKQLEQKP